MTVVNKDIGEKSMTKSILFWLLICVFLTASHISEAQHPERMRRIGALMNLEANDSESQIYIAAFLEGLQKLGWTVGHNVQIDYRWTAGDPNRIRKYAEELLALAPDVILTVGGSHVGPLQQVTRSVPIVFVQVADAVGGGFVNSLARPGGNATGFTNFEFDISTKWLEMLKQIAPRMTRTAVLRDPTNPSGTGQFGAIQAVAPSLGVEASPVGLHDASEIERGLTGFAHEPNGGVIVTPSSLAIVHRKLIISLAARLRLPAIYPFRYFVTDGGLISYGPDVVDQYRRAAGYVDRILKGEKPADLPVQQSTKVDLVINLKAAKQIGLTIPPNVLARADKVIKESAGINRH
jgi:putative tryptophan/tyrosine transport system substrate-binding protein